MRLQPSATLTRHPHAFALDDRVGLTAVAVLERESVEVTDQREHRAASVPPAPTPCSKRGYGRRSGSTRPAPGATRRGTLLIKGADVHPACRKSRHLTAFQLPVKPAQSRWLFTCPKRDHLRLHPLIGWVPHAAACHSRRAPNDVRAERGVPAADGLVTP